VNKKSGKKRSESRAYLAEIKDGYVAVVEGAGEAKIKDERTIKKIKKLLKVRKKAHEQLGEIIKDKGISTASIHKVNVLGEGD
jgi:uncharacterized phage infection (PIP) family protein YhgE